MASPLVDYRSLMTPDSIVIYPSRRKLLLIIAGCSAFVALGIFILISDDKALFLGVSTIAVFGLGLLYPAVRLARPTPAVIIHYSGIFDNASGLSAGFLPWEEIMDMYMAKIKNQRMLAIRVKDVESFLNRQSGLKANLMKINVSLIGAPINIPATALPISLEELIQSIQQKCPGITILSRDA
jgi:hypothetical protein